MLAKGGATADRPAPGRQSSETLAQSAFDWARRSGEIGWGDRSVGTRPSAPPLWLDNVDVRINGQGTNCPVGKLPAQPKVTQKGEAR